MLRFISIPKVLAFYLFICLPVYATDAQISQWQTLDTIGKPTARHEASFVAYKDKLYLIGGRGMKPVDVYDPQTNRWQSKSTPPLEIHHFQAVAGEDAIYIVGAMTGPWPNETPVQRVLKYYPERDKFEFSHEIPADRRRGSAGAVLYQDKIYLVGGITNGHMNGYVAWFDEYNPITGEWRILADAPHQRDHFAAVVAKHKLYAIAGRRTEHAIGKSFESTERRGDVYNFKNKQWQALSDELDIPTARAGNMIVSWQDEIIIGGGESGSQISAHSEVEAYDSVSGQWRSWPSLNTGRHGSGFAVIGDYLYTASGCGNRGGEPELASLERLKLSKTDRQQPNSIKNILQQSHTLIQKWHTFTLSVLGPETSELAKRNPFTDYKLEVSFTGPKGDYSVRGFYAADGNAAETSADSGKVWQAKFTPDIEGKWKYSARLSQGKDIAIRAFDEAKDSIVTELNGEFSVIPSEATSPDFKAKDRGRLVRQNRYFQFEGSEKLWIKGGTNSPENFLAYADFDGTYRVQQSARDGEASALGEIHYYRPHIEDWQIGDPVWQGDKGKGIIGGINYLAEMGVNSVYFLTLNILGDGNDVWPYRSSTDFTRFDVSKLAQWEKVFSHMQAKGILLHVVIQETENELMLDQGDTARLRSLYFAELIARFSHHPALVWNLGEENGPVHWRPEGQNTKQRKAMATFFQQHDPYQHPVLLHTHSEPREKQSIASPLLGFPALDGLSLQISDRTQVYAQTLEWRKKAEQADHDWILTMDEIGLWHTGAMPDELNPEHTMLRRHVLWGHLLAGGAGVEWYFGAHFPSNDLSTEDWRTRHTLWKQTTLAREFFEQHLPIADLQPCSSSTIDRPDSYCASDNKGLLAAYLPEGGTAIVDLGNDNKTYNIFWFDPVNGGSLQMGSVEQLVAKGRQSLGQPPKIDGKDWVVLVTAQ